MDNTNPVTEEKTVNNKAKPLLFVKTSTTGFGPITWQEEVRPSGLSLSQILMIVGGAVLILTNITLITLASLKVLGIISYP
jgi:hypothetical protein